MRSGLRYRQSSDGLSVPPDLVQIDCAPALRAQIPQMLATIRRFIGTLGYRLFSILLSHDQKEIGIAISQFTNPLGDPE